MTFPYTALGNQWTHPHLEDSGDLSGKTDTRLNGLRTAMSGFGQTTGSMPLAAFRAASRGGPTLTSNAAMAWDTVIEDTAGGYDAANHVYVIPGPGVYLCRFQLRQSTAVTFTAALAGPDGTVYIGGIRSYACAAVAGHGPELPLVPIRFKGGEQVSVIPAFGGTVTLQADSTTDRSFFTIDQIVSGL